MIAWSVVPAAVNGPTFCCVAVPIFPLRTTIFSSQPVGSLAVTDAFVPTPFGRSETSIYVIYPRAIGVDPEYRVSKNRTRALSFNVERANQGLPTERASVTSKEIVAPPPFAA